MSDRATVSIIALLVAGFLGVFFMGNSCFTQERECRASAYERCISSTKAEPLACTDSSQMLCDVGGGRRR